MARSCRNPRPPIHSRSGHRVAAEVAKLDAIRREEAKAALEAKDAEANAKAEEIEALKAKTEALGEASPQSGEQAHCFQGGAV